MKMTAHEWSFDGKLTECLCRSKIQGRMQFYNDQWFIIFCLIIINRKQALWYFVVYQLVLLFALYIMCIVCWSSSVSMMEHNFLTTQHIPVYWNVDLIRFVTYLLVPCFSFFLFPSHANRKWVLLQFSLIFRSKGEIILIYDFKLTGKWFSEQLYFPSWMLRYLSTLITSYGSLSL